MYSFLTLIAFGVVVDYVFIAIFRARKKSRFVVTENSRDWYSFYTDVGEFRIDRTNRMLRYTILGTRNSIALDDLSRLKFGYADKSALLQEIFFGFDFTDAFSSYQDSVHWYTIQLITNQDEQVPLFTAGQYEPREFLLTWYVRLQERVLERMGLFHDVHDYAQLVLEEIKDGFRESGCTMKYH